MTLQIAILGAGITGLSSALALSRYLPDPRPQITIYEIRTSLSNIGGAVSLTPKALRYLSYLGIDSRQLGAECRTIQLYDLYTGVNYSAVGFKGLDGNGIGHGDATKFFSARVMRRELQGALLKAVEQATNVSICWGKEIIRIEESQNDGSVRLFFADGHRASHSLLLGCDGIHSAARRLLVDPERIPRYTGIAVVLANVTLRQNAHLPWVTTGLTSSRRGSFMSSFYEQSKSLQYIAVVMEINEPTDREGWQARGADQAAIKADILERFTSEKMPQLAELVEDAGQWTLYPVHKLPPKGRWCSEGSRCVLLGDSAHAMPPQGESTGICIEDAILFSRAMSQHRSKDLSAILIAYENFRRPHINSAYDQAVQQWETVKDSGAFVYRLKMLLTPWLLWWTAKARDEEYATDYSHYEFMI